MQAEICRLKSGLICSGKESNTNARFMDDALKIRGVKYLNVETWLLFPSCIKISVYAPGRSHTKYEGRRQQIV